MLNEPRAANCGARYSGAPIRNGYLRNAVAYRCVRMVAEAAESIPLKTAHEGAGALLRRPAPDLVPAGFLEAVFSELLLSGNAFGQAVRLPGGSAIAALFPLRSGAVRQVNDTCGCVEAYREATFWRITVLPLAARVAEGEALWGRLVEATSLTHGEKHRIAELGQCVLTVV